MQMTTEEFREILAAQLAPIVESQKTISASVQVLVVEQEKTSVTLFGQNKDNGWNQKLKDHDAKFRESDERFAETHTTTEAQFKSVDEKFVAGSKEMLTLKTQVWTTIKVISGVWAIIVAGLAIIIAWVKQ